MIYFDNAATTSKKPKSVYRAVKKALKHFSANPGRSGHITSLLTSNEVYECREKAALFFGENDPERTVFTLNCTMALNMAIKGVLKEGDHAIVSCLDHNASVRPLYAMRSAGIIDFDVSNVYAGDAERTVESFKNLIRPETKLIVCSHISNVTGAILPLREIGELAKENGITFIVDAAQSAGLVPVDINKLNANVVCAPGHKGLYGPMGTGVMILSDGQKLSTIIEGGTGSLSSSLEQPNFLPDRFESGTLNVPGICGLAAGIDFVNSYGIEKILRHEEEITQFIYDELKSLPSVELYSKRPQTGVTAPLISFNMKGWSSGKTAASLYEHRVAVRAGLHCAFLAHRFLGTLDRGTVRVSPSVFSSFDEAEKFIKIVKKI